MVFALETYCAATDGRSAARIEEEVVVTKDGNRDPHPLPRRGAARRRQDVRARRRRARARGPALGGMSRYRLIRREEIELEPALPEHSVGLTRADADRRRRPARRTPGLTLVELEDGHVDTHLHSFETSFYVFSGEPRPLPGRPRRRARAGRMRRDPGRRAARLAQRTSAHAGSRWRRRGRAAPDQPPDTFFLGAAPDDEPEALDLRDPRNRNLFHLSAERHGRRHG